jgi:outer membrane receptor for ferrienterochelin and colicins
MSKYNTIFILTLFLWNFAIRAQNNLPDSDSTSLRALEEIVVTGTFTPRTLKSTPVLTRVISGNDLREAGTPTLVEALENFIPGVSFIPNQAMGDDIRIQGLESKYILILVDGERLVGERTEKVNLSRLNTADIKQVEIINGASSVLYGSNAIGSIINIITRDADQNLQGDARLRFSDYLMTNDANLRFKIKSVSSKTSFSRKDMQTYDVKETSYSADPYEDYSLSQSFRYKNKKLDAELKGNYFNQKNWLLQKNQVRQDENYTIGGKVNYVFSSKNALTLSGNSDNYDGHLIKKLENSTEHANGSQYNAFKLIDAWNIADKIQLISGAEMIFEKTFSYNQFGDDADEKNASNWNLFAQGEWKTGTGLDVLAGLRYTRHSQFGGYLSPGISLMYSLNDFRFRANIGNGYKAPTLKEMFMEFPHYIGENLPFWVVGNPGLSPEKSVYKAVSTEYAGNDLNASITLYNNAIKNKINTIQVFNDAKNRTEMRYENIEEVAISGVDLSLQYAFLNHFRLRGGYAFTNAIDKTTRRQLSGNSKHTATVNLQFLQKHLPFLPSSSQWGYNLLLSGRVASPHAIYSETNGQVTELATGNYYIANFVYTQRFPIYKNVKGDFQLGVNNLLDYINRDFAAYNPGRTFFTSLEIRF